jgi:hypothetical protein
MSKEEQETKWMDNNLNKYEYVALTEDEKKQGIKDDIVNNLLQLYKLADTTLNNKDSLVKKEKVFIENYRGFSQTEFGNKLKDVLKLITKDCVNYIDKRLSNLLIDPFDYENYIWVSSLTCYSSNNINKLYEYLKGDKFTRSHLYTIDAEELEKTKTELKYKLKSYLIDICQDPELKIVIQDITIPENISVLITQNNPWTKTTVDEAELYTGKGGGGNIKITRTNKKDILGKERCIYKKSGDRKEYVKYKGDLITVNDFKKLMKSKETRRKHK